MARRDEDSVRERVATRQGIVERSEERRSDNSDKRAHNENLTM